MAMAVLAAGASHATAKGLQISCQLSGFVLVQNATGQRFSRTLLFNLDDSSAQLNSGISGVLATTMGYSDLKVEGRLRDVASTGDAAPSLFGNFLDGLNVSQSNFFLDRFSGDAVLSATFSNGAVFAIGPCGAASGLRRQQLSQARL